MATDELGSMLNRIRIAENEDGILPLHMVWKQEDATMDKLQLASLTPEQYDFSTNPFWVRIFDVPVGLHSEEIGFLIGSSLGQVLEVDEGFKKAVRVRLELNVANPLRHFKISQITNTESRKLQIKYERLPEFCSVCGCLGHVENDCDIAHRIKDVGGKIIRRFGPWLKAELENSWCPDDFDALDEAFCKNTQFATGYKGISDTEHSENGENQSLNTMPLCGGQVEGGNTVSVHVEGGNNENGTKEVVVGIEAHQTRVGLPSIAEVQLVEVPLSQQFKDMITHRGKGKTAKANKGSWKRLDRIVTSTLHAENNT
ncbi:hypothetical protein SLEP1_g3472 [Rubroshorea leprosula]|uniref:Zinc knuckle CX2CX4HX4C domain-containing protein n=1 Tax=Rubroshorea leprosula TaxID=152421 RepID=A0AAV5HW05_9ROSI|nr:hypothetical protein SLEP1_g3472 [Rubroshorea leprosula]